MTEYCLPEKENVALITISAQRDFVRGESPLCANGHSRAVPALKRVVEAFRRQGAPIFHSVRLYRADGSNAEPCRRSAFEEGLRILMPGTSGAELIDEIKTDPLRFFMTWTLQGLWVLLTVACALAIITGVDREPIGWIAALGIVVWVAGFAIEVQSDRQKSTFKEDPANDGKFITTGLWAWSRHPNYFGEVVLWVGIAIMALPVLSGWRWVTLVSPVFVFVLLTKVSGIPMLESRAEKRWGDTDEFRRYTTNTPVLIPRRPKA